MKEMIKPIFNMPSIKYNKSTNYQYEGMNVPRVTEILSTCIHSDALMYWANSLGFKRQSYKKTLNLSASIGTECHEYIDDFLDNPNLDMQFTYDKAQNAYNSFRKWWDDINSNAKVSIVLKEYKLVCKYFGGTLDGLYNIDGKLYLVDYKTSNHITYKYCLQVAAYRYLLRDQLGIDIDGAIILQLSKNDVSYNECFLDFNNKEHLRYINECEQAFLSLVYAFYNIFRVEGGYKTLNWE